MHTSMKLKYEPSSEPLVLAQSAHPSQAALDSASYFWEISEETHLDGALLAGTEDVGLMKRLSTF